MIKNDRNNNNGYFGRVIGSFVCLEDGECKLKAVIYNEYENDRQVIDCSFNADIIADCLPKYLLALNNKKTPQEVNEFPKIGQEITVIGGTRYPHSTKGIVKRCDKDLSNEGFERFVIFNINYNPTEHWINIHDITWKGKHDEK